MLGNDFVIAHITQEAWNDSDTDIRDYVSLTWLEKATCWRFPLRYLFFCGAV